MQKPGPQSFTSSYLRFQARRERRARRRFSRFAIVSQVRAKARGRSAAFCSCLLLPERFGRGEALILNAPRFFIIVVQMRSVKCTDRSSRNLLMWDYGSQVQNKAIYSRSIRAFEDNIYILLRAKVLGLSLSTKASICSSSEPNFSSVSPH